MSTFNLKILRYLVCNIKTKMQIHFDESNVRLNPKIVRFGVVQNSIAGLF